MARFGRVRVPCMILSVLMEKLPYEEWKLALIEEITAAFDGVRRENGVSLSEAQVVDDYGSEEERAEARKQDTEKRWQDVPEKDIAYGHISLAYFDEIGFRYYIPAYIIWSLRNMNNRDRNSPSYGSMTHGTIIYSLGGFGIRDLDEYDRSRFKGLTSDQSRAIAHFLKFKEEYLEAFFLKEDQETRDEMANEGYTPEEIESQLIEDNKIRKNAARRALDQYWGQFL